MSVNYLGKLEQYVKCGESQKLLEPAPNSTESSGNGTGDNATEGYETPVKIRTKTDRTKTPTNECPQYYTDMEACKAK